MATNYKPQLEQLEDRVLMSGPGVQPPFRPWPGFIQPPLQGPFWPGHVPMWISPPWPGFVPQYPWNQFPQRPFTGYIPPRPILPMPPGGPSQ